MALCKNVSCAQKKRHFHHSKPSHLPFAASAPWEVVAPDIMSPLPVRNLGNSYIVIAGDLFTEYIEAAALSSIETRLISRVFLDKVVFRHGPPYRFLTYRMKNFTSKLMIQLCKDLNINMVLTSIYQRQSDGFAECNTYAYNTSVFETTVAIKLPDVALQNPTI